MIIYKEKKLENKVRRKKCNSRVLHFSLIKSRFNWRSNVTKKKNVSFLHKVLVRSAFSRTWLQGSERRESNKRRVNAMMRRNLFISKLWSLSFSAEGTLVDGRNFPSPGSKCFSETSLRYIAPIFRQEQRIDKRHESSSETVHPLFPGLSLTRCFATWYTTSPGTCISRRKKYIPLGIRTEVTLGKVSEKGNVFSFHISRF